MKLYSINRTVGDWNVWYVGGVTKPRWSNEFPDAKLYTSKARAEGDLNMIKARMGAAAGDASVSEETIEN